MSLTGHGWAWGVGLEGLMGLGGGDKEPMTAGIEDMEMRMARAIGDWQSWLGEAVMAWAT